MIWCLVALTALLVETRVAEESRNWSCDAEELAASFTVHARDLFSPDADRGSLPVGEVADLLESIATRRSTSG